TMKVEQRVQVDVRHTVAPCQHERRVGEPRLQALDAAAGQGREAGIDEVYGPIDALGPVVHDLPGTGPHGHVAVQNAVVAHPALDVLALVADRYHEGVESVAIVVSHDVPEDRLAADLDHRFRFGLGLFSEARAGTAGQNSDFWL